jgi:serine/threonine-protein kinase RsbW
MIDARVTLPRQRWTVPLARHLTRVLLDGAQVTGDDRDDIEIAVSEACGNAVRHARSTDRYHLRLHLGGGACVVEVTDDGSGFSPSTSPSPSSTGVASSGRGLAIIRRLADELEVRRRRPGTLVRFRKRLA